MASRRRAGLANGLLTTFVIGYVPLRRRLRSALLLRSRRLMMIAFVWRIARRVMVGTPTPVRIVKTRSAAIETE